MTSGMRNILAKALFPVLVSLSAHASVTDRDNDGVLNADDAFPDVSLGSLLDTDRDGRPDDCDASCEALGMTADDDDDGDGVSDSDDAYPLISLSPMDSVQLGDDIAYTGTVRMSADGLTIAVADDQEDSGGLLDAGAVRVFQYSDGSWEQMGSTIVGSNAYDYAGWGLSLSDDGLSLAVGFPGEAMYRGADYGVVRAYTWDSDSAEWVQRGADIYQPGTTSSSSFGRRAVFGGTNDVLILGTSSWFSRYEWTGDAWESLGSALSHNTSSYPDIDVRGDVVLAGPCSGGFQWNGVGWDSLGFSNCSSYGGSHYGDTRSLDLARVHDEERGDYFVRLYGGYRDSNQRGPRILGGYGLDTSSNARSFINTTTSGSYWSYGKTSALDASASTMLISGPGYARNSDGSNIGRVDILRRESDSYVGS